MLKTVRPPGNVQVFFLMFPPAPCRTRAGLKQRTASSASPSTVWTLQEPEPTSERWFTSCTPWKTRLGRALGSKLLLWLSSLLAKMKVGLASEDLRSQRRRSPAACQTLQTLVGAPPSWTSYTSPVRAFFFYLLAKRKKSTNAASPKITVNCTNQVQIPVSLLGSCLCGDDNDHSSYIRPQQKNQTDKTETLPGHWLKTTSCSCLFLCWWLHSSSRRGRATQPSGRRRCLSTRAPDWTTAGR